MYGKDKNKKTPYGVFGITLAHVSMSFIIYDSVDSHCNYSAIALHLNPRLKYTAKRPIKRQNKVSIFLAYVRYFLYLYTYERASYGHIKSTARHDSRDKVDA